MCKCTAFLCWGVQGVSTARCKFLIPQHYVTTWFVTVTIYLCVSHTHTRAACAHMVHITTPTTCVCRYICVCICVSQHRCMLMCKNHLHAVCWRVAVCQLGQSCNHKTRWSTLNIKPVQLPTSQGRELILRGAKPLHKCLHLAVILHIKWKIWWLGSKKKPWSNFISWVLIAIYTLKR